MKTLLSIILLTLLIMPHTISAQQVEYPKTHQINHTDEYFGTVISDPYQWLEDDRSEETMTWVQKQNEVTQKYLAQIEFKDQIKERLNVINNYEKTSSYSKLGELTIFLKNSGLQNQAVWKYIESETGEEKTLLDPNELDSKGTTTFNFLDYNKDKHLVTVAINQAGSDWANIQIFDLNTFEFLEDKLEWVKFSNTEWYQDGFYYSRYPTPEKGKELSASSEFQGIYYHKLGTPQEEDILIYLDEENPKHYHNLYLSDDKKHQILYKRSGTDGFEILYRTQSKNIESSTPFQYLFEGFEHKQYIIASNGNKWLVLTDREAPNYKIVEIDINQPEKAWKTIIPEGASVIESAKVLKGKIIVNYLENAHSIIQVFDKNGAFENEVKLPGLGTATLTYTKPEDPEIYFSYTDFTTPSTPFSYQTENQSIKQLSSAQLNFDVHQFESKQVWYPSRDGTLIPMFIIHKKGLKLEGNHPTYLYAYGGFNVNITPSFSTSYISLLEQDVVIAIPNLRGGGEFGEAWHQAGMLTKKQNVFDDFIAAAEYLIREKYTSSSKLAIAGGSNGGLLVGACMTQRPELFQVAFPAVGVLDMLKYQNFTVGWGWVPEYGSSEQSKKMFEYLLGYSPYHNLQKGVDYPATMITTADHDDRVVPAHSFKFAARLQELTLNKRPALIRIDVDAGHGAGKPISKIIDEAADKWSFFLWNVGVERLKK